jgi:hypothetical protein
MGTRELALEISVFEQTGGFVFEFNYFVERARPGGWFSDSGRCCACCVGWTLTIARLRSGGILSQVLRLLCRLDLNDPLTAVGGIPEAGAALAV